MNLISLLLSVASIGIALLALALNFVQFVSSKNEQRLRIQAIEYSSSIFPSDSFLSSPNRLVILLDLNNNSTVPLVINRISIVSDLSKKLFPAERFPKELIRLSVKENTTFAQASTSFPINISGRTSVPALISFPISKSVNNDNIDELETLIIETNRGTVSKKINQRKIFDSSTLHFIQQIIPH